METVRFENDQLPVCIRTENCADRSMHSEISHWHDFIELILIERGSALCRTCDEGISLQKGDVCFINRRQLHRLSPEKATGCAHTVIMIGTSLLSQNEEVYQKQIRPMLEDASFSHIKFAGTDSPAAKIFSLVKQALVLQQEQELGYELELIAVVLQIVRQLIIAYTSGPAPKAVDVNALIQQRMVEFIYQNYDRSLSLDEIAAAGNISRSQCSKLFKRYTGLSPIALLNQHRLELCLDRLRNTGDSVSSIAFSCGFSDQSYFNRLFLRTYGVTPLSYRRSRVK